MSRQFTELSIWAKGFGILQNYQPPEGSEKTSGTEHEVYFHEKERRVFKKTKNGQFGSIRTETGTYRTATPYFYLRRLEWSNEVFDSDFKLEWIVPEPTRAIVISQPMAIAANKAKPTPTEEEISRFMTKMEFQSVKGNPQEWYRTSDACSACDAKGENFIATAYGIRPIDLIVSKDLGFNPHDL